MNPANVTIALQFRKAIRAIPECAAGACAGAFRGVYSDGPSAAAGRVAASATVVVGSLAAVFLGVLLAVFFGAAFFITAGFPVLFAAASAFCRWNSAYLFPVASTMRLRPAALRFRPDRVVLVAAVGFPAPFAAAAFFRWYSAHRFF